MSAEPHRLDTIDIDRDMVKQCRENLKKANLGKTVTCIEGDAMKVLSTLEGEIDFLFLDAVREDYLKYFKARDLRVAYSEVVRHQAGRRGRHGP